MDRHNVPVATPQAQYQLDGVSEQDLHAALVLLNRGVRHILPSDGPVDGIWDQGDTRALTATPDYQRAFGTWLRAGDDRDLRSMNITVDPAGGYMVPDQLHSAFVAALVDYFAMRRYATVIQTSAAADVLIPVQSAAARWMAEEGEYVADDDVFTAITLGGHKLGRLQKVSEELTQDSQFDLEALLVRLFGQAYGAAEQAAFTTGDGVGKPTGFMLDAEIGVTAAAAAVIDPDEIVDLFYSLKAPYRSRAIWIMNDSTIAVIRKMLTGAGTYVWTPSLAVGQPDQLMGRPVVANGSMADIAADAKPIAFGDFSFYWIAERGAPIFQRLIELYAANGQVGYRMARRLDGKLTIPEAVKALKMAAA